MERFKELKGVLLTSDPSAPDEGVLVGGQNMLKRNSLGMKRRPGFGAFDVESAAAVLHGASITNARATFQFLSEVFGLHDGILTKYDGSDSFDQITESLTDAIPTFGEIGGYGILATGGRVLKYDGGRTPSPLGSALLSDMESGEQVSGGTADTADNVAGTQSRKLTITGAGNDTIVIVPGDTLLTTGADTYGPGIYFSLGRSLTNTRDWAASIYASASTTFNKVLFEVVSKTGSPTGNITIRIQAADSNGNPSGVDLTTGTIACSAIAAGGGIYIVTMGDDVTIQAGDSIFILFDIAAQSSDDLLVLLQASEPDGGLSGAKYRDDVDGAGGSWTQFSTGATPLAQILYEADLYTGYPDASTIKLQIKANTPGNVAFGSGTYIRLIKDGSNYLEYQFVSADITTGWLEVTLVRGEDGSDFTKTGTDSWQVILSAVTQIDVKITTSGSANINVDYVYMLHQWAPPASSKVFVADGRTWVASGRKLYYSEKWNPNVFYKDTYMQFPDDVIAIAVAGSNVLFLLKTGAWRGIPLSGFPDYKVDELSPFGCIDPKAVAEITYKGKAGAAWISRNTGVMFWDGLGDPIPISLAIDEIFTEGGSNNQNFKYSRSDEVVVFFHERYEELWILYPTLYTGETNLKYGWILNCRTGMWMPQFVWSGSSNLVYGTVYRDPNDSLYKVLLTDSAGAVFHEGYVGSTSLSATTSKDGYVDGSTTGAAVKGYVELGYIGGARADKTDKDAVFHDVHMKYIPGTTSAFAINLDYRVAEKGDETVDQEIYPGEGEVTFGQAWTDIGERSTTPSNADDVIERNVKFPSDVRGHAVGVRVGQVDAGGTVEWELLGVSVDRVPRYGER